jgi:hypothetical protein
MSKKYVPVLSEYYVEKIAHFWRYVRMYNISESKSISVIRCKGAILLDPSNLYCGTSIEW